MPGASEIKAGAAYVEIGGRDKKLTEALGRAQKKLQTFSAGAMNLGKQFAVVGAVMAAPLVMAIRRAGDYEEELSKFRAVFKELAGPAEAWVEALSEELGRSKSDLTSFMATLQDTFVPLGFARDEGLKMSKMLTQLTIDVASFQNKAEPDVLRDFQSAIVGNHETVRKYGIIITEAQLNQKLMTMGIEGGNKAATNQQKVLARLKIITEGTADAQGDAARTSGSYANTVRRLKSQIDNLAIAVGQHLLPTVTDFVAKAADSVKLLVTWIKNNRDAVVGFAKLTTVVLGLAAAFVTLGIAMKVLAFLAGTSGPWGLIIAAAVLLLDTLGLIDIGFSQLVGSIKIGGMSMKDNWGLAIAYMKKTWFSAIEGILNGLNKILESWKLILIQMSKSSLLPKMVKDALKDSAAALNLSSAGIDLWVVATGQKKAAAEQEIRDIAKRISDAGKPLERGLCAGLTTVKKILFPDKDEAAAGGAAALGALAGDVVGTFSGATAGLLGGSPRVLTEQLSEMKKQTDIQTVIAKNTGKNIGATFQ